METSNSIISIGDKKLNSDNLYYLFENKKNNEKLTLKAENSDAIIEILYNSTLNSVVENINYDKT